MNSKHLNKYSFKNSDPSYYQFTGNEFVILIDENGTTNRFRLQEEPVYNSTAVYSDGTKNYYPNGSALESLQPSSDNFQLLPDGSFLLAKKDKTKYFYSLYGQLERIEDQNGNSIHFSYDTAHRLMTISDDCNRHITLTRTGDKISSILAPDGSSVTCGYNSAGMLSSVTDRDGDTVNYVYQGNLLTEIIKPDGSRRNYYYENQNDKMVMTHNTDEEGDTEYYTYHFSEGYSEYTNPEGISEFHYFNDRNRETKVVYGDGSYIENTYDSNNNLKTYRSRTGFVTTYEYDENRNITRIEYPDGNYESFSYNSANQLTERLDPDGNQTVNDYDDKGNLTSSKIYSINGALESETIMTYFENSLLESRSRWNSETSRYSTEYFTYDDSGNISNVVDGEGNNWEYSFSVTGLLKSVTDPTGDVTAYEYTPSGKITKVLYPDNTFEQTFYTNRKDIDYIIDRDGNRYDYTYNKRHNLLSIETPLGEIVQYNYAPGGKVLDKSTYSTDGSLETYQEYQYDQYTGELLLDRNQLDNDSLEEPEDQYRNGLLLNEIQ